MHDHMMSAGEGVEQSTERAREAGPPRREEGWAPDHEKGAQRVLEGLRRQARISAFSVNRIRVRVRKL